MLIIRQLKSVFNTVIIIPQKCSFVNRNLQKTRRKTEFLYILAKCLEMIMVRMPIDSVDNSPLRQGNCAFCSKNLRYFAQIDYLQISFYVIK